MISPVKGFVLFGGDTGKSRHRAKSSAHVLVHYQRSLKFYVHLYIPFAALRPEYCLVQAVLFSTLRIHSWEGISVLKILYTFWNVLRYGIRRLAGRHSCATVAALQFLILVADIPLCYIIKYTTICYVFNWKYTLFDRFRSNMIIIRPYLYKD